MHEYSMRQAPGQVPWLAMHQVITNVDVERVAAIVSKGSAVQIISDGGYDGECGAPAAVVVIGSRK